MNIKLVLSPSGIKKAQEELAKYKRALNDRLELFVSRLSEEGLNVASAKFAAAEYDGTNDVSVRVEQDGATAYIIAEGKAVAFIEFGTGIRNPEHPSGLFKHGTYGRQQGADPGWWMYSGEAGTNGELVNGRTGSYISKGNPPAEAMWGAATDMAAKITQVWEEVMRG